MPPPAVTLTFDFLTPNVKQQIYEFKYICDQNCVKFPSLVFEIRCSKGQRSRSQQAMTLTFDLLTPKLNQHIRGPKYICDQNWAKFHSLFFEIHRSQSFRDAQTHSLTHRRTDPNAVCLRHRFSTAAEARKQ